MSTVFYVLFFLIHHIHTHAQASKTKRQVVTINGKEKTVVVAEGLSGMEKRDKLMTQRREEREAKRKEKDATAAAEQQLAVEREKKKVERLTKSIALSRQREEEARQKAREESGEQGESKNKRREDSNSKREHNAAAATPKHKPSPAEVSTCPPHWSLQSQQTMQYILCVCIYAILWGWCSACIVLHCTHTVRVVIVDTDHGKITATAARMGGQMRKRKTGEEGQVSADQAR
jgi:hypothetical protein